MLSDISYTHLFLLLVSFRWFFEVETGTLFHFRGLRWIIFIFLWSTFRSSSLQKRKIRGLRWIIFIFLWLTFRSSSLQKRKIIKKSSDFVFTMWKMRMEISWNIVKYTDESVISVRTKNQRRISSASKEQFNTNTRHFGSTMFWLSLL